jgi:hypothetical protein
MLVAKGVEDETMFGYKRVSVGWKPLCHSRFNTPRKEWRLKIKKAIASEKLLSAFSLIEFEAKLLLYFYPKSTTFSDYLYRGGIIFATR